MNWFKHYSNSQESNSLRELKRQFGFEGLGRYWAFIEFISDRWIYADEMPIFEIQREDLRNLFGHRSWNGLRLFGDHLATIPGLEIEQTGNVWKIKAPILLKIKNNDFKKTRSKPDQKLPKNKEKEKEKEYSLKKLEKKDFPKKTAAKKPSTKKPKDLAEPFLEAYSLYPRKIERSTAYRTWIKISDGSENPQGLIQAIKNYSEYVSLQNKEKEHIKHFSTFLNQYEDYLDKDWIVHELEALKINKKDLQSGDKNIYRKPIKDFKSFDRIKSDNNMARLKNLMENGK